MDKRRDAFRTLFGAATLTRHFTPTAFLALQWSGFGTRERETYDIQGQYWLNEVTTRKQLGVGTYMEHARNALTARVMKAGLRGGMKIGEHRLLGGLDWRRESAMNGLWSGRCEIPPVILCPTDRMLYI